MTDELQRKVDRAVKLIQQAGRDGMEVEVAYSGGKDSDVILELARMSGIEYWAIFGRLAGAPGVVHSETCPCKQNNNDLKKN